ncbi:MAG: hypothetical protein JWN44_3819 [Myxococcales bacterium]|nr:hypothetical protein [Myxococcales bacterium]
MRPTKRGLLVAVAAAVLLPSAAVRADVELKFGGQIASDIRYRLGGEETPPAGPNSVVPFPSQQRLLKYGFSRNENLIKAQLTLSIADRVKAVADIDFYWYGYSDVNDIQAETLHERVDPYRLEANAAYVDIYKLLPKLDLRIGRQVVVWGTADKFNPTNNLNTLDLSDPLLFGKALANNMVRADWNPFGDVILTAVWVPIFRPAQLPRTAPIAVTEANRPAPVQEQYIRSTLGAFAQAMPPTQINVLTMQPDPSISNSQVGVRLAGRLLGMDASVSYYHGRWGIPTPAWAVQKPNGIVDAIVMWPKMDVLGADIAGSIEKLKGLGYWVEAAVFFPQKITYGVYNDIYGGHDPITFEPKGTKDASGNEEFQTHIMGPEFQRGTVIPSTPFLKLAAGADFTWNKYLYSNLQYVYGFIDEFGAGRQCFARPNSMPGDDPRCEARIGHYLVLGSDLKLFSDQLLIRFFGAFKVPQIGDQDPRFTAVLFPQLAWAVWDATEISLGAFVFLGPRDSKFGDPAAGASEIFMKARFTY